MTQPHFRAMNEQIKNMQEAFTRFRDLWVEFTQWEENSNRSVAELESENSRLSTKVEELAHQNQELQRRVEIHKPELERAIDAREAAFRKLENAYRVIRDLINEVERLQVVNGLQSGNQTKIGESADMRQVIREAMAQSNSSGNSDSDRTPRQHSSPLRRGVPQRGTAKPEAHNGHRRSTAEGQSIASSHSPSHLPSPETSSNESASDSEISSPSSFANVGDDERWSIHYGSPPGVCNMSFGPVTHGRLLQHSIITTEHVEELRQLEDAGDLCLRLYSTNNLVFLNDPIFLEERAEGIKKTYILDWGTAEENAPPTEFFRSRRGMLLHTFVFPEKKKKWYYVGGFTWQVANHVHVIWSSLGETSRKKVLSKLCERSPDYSETEVAAKLDDSRLFQICLEISSDGLWEESREFASRMGYESPPHDES